MEKLVENLSLNEAETKGKRMLASVQVISSITEIKKVNKFDMAKVLGWNVLVKKNEYKVGDKIIHDTFKQGIVVGVDKSILTIAFPHPIGIKKLLKGHKSIKKI